MHAYSLDTRTKPYVTSSIAEWSVLTSVIRPIPELLPMIPIDSF